MVGQAVNRYRPFRKYPVVGASPRRKPALDKKSISGVRCKVMQISKFVYSLVEVQEHHMQGRKVNWHLLKTLNELKRHGVFIPYRKTPQFISLFGTEIEPDKSY